MWIGLRFGGVEPGGGDDGDDDGVEEEEEVRRLEAEEEEGPELREVSGGDGKRDFDSEGGEDEGDGEKKKFPRTHGFGGFEGMRREWC